MKFAYITILILLLFNITFQNTAYNQEKLEKGDVPSKNIKHLKAKKSSTPAGIEDQEDQETDDFETLIQQKSIDDLNKKGFTTTNNQAPELPNSNAGGNIESTPITTTRKIVKSN